MCILFGRMYLLKSVSKWTRFEQNRRAAAHSALCAMISLFGTLAHGSKNSSANACFEVLLRGLGRLS